MANYRRGEVEIEFGNKAYVLRYDLNAICILEERLDRPFKEIFTERMSFREIREGLHVGLQYKGNKKLTRLDVGEMMEAKQLPYYTTQLMTAIKGAMNVDDDEVEEGEGSDGPPDEKAQEK